jgi:hypothetical protein
MISLLGELVSAMIVLMLAIGYALVLVIPLLGFIGGLVYLLYHNPKKGMSSSISARKRDREQEPGSFSLNRESSKKRRVRWALAYR